MIPSYGTEYDDVDQFYDPASDVVHIGHKMTVDADPYADVPTPEDERATAPATDIGELYPALDWHDVWSQTPDEVDWLVEPIIERGRLYALYSPPKVGKSLLALEIAAALATGRPVFGNPARDPVRVLYVDLENSPADLVERLTAYGYRPADLDNLRYLSFPSLPVLDSPIGGQHLLAAVQHYAAEVVIIDTVSRVVAGKENDSDTFHTLYRCALAPLGSPCSGAASAETSGRPPSALMGRARSRARCGPSCPTVWP